MKTADDISAMMKDLFSDTLQEMLEAELDTTRGYEKMSLPRKTELTIYGKQRDRYLVSKSRR